MGYMNYQKAKQLNPLVDPWYFCGQCGRWNNPFDYKNGDFERVCKKNLCKNCFEKLDKKGLFGHERANKE
jgi:NADH pyrophosphatase NudC (nudix superfamily)